MALRLLKSLHMRGLWLVVLLSACTAEAFVDDPADDAWLAGKASGLDATPIAEARLRRRF